MSLTAGTRLGPYEILGPLGKGGMGEVYRASDTRLHRTVAIKILPRDKVADPERKRRFLQEARAASALNHPNIVAVYDVACDSGIDYMVMEYVPGKSLDRIITPKGLPLPEALGYMQQVGGALAAAHAAAIVHRDIKPANVIVTAESQIKVLDFGLAKLLERTVGPEDETQTQDSALTESGKVLGTVAYMSPEQVSAKPLDHRTDIFSLGVMLYELLAGARPFRGQTPVETMHAILRDPPPPLGQFPAELAEILAKALAKDPKDRYHHVADFALDLRRFLHALTTKTLPSMQTGAAPRKRRLGWVIVAVVGVAGLVAAWLVGRRGASTLDENPIANARFTRFTNFEGSENNAAISPDGKFVAFRADRDGRFDIWLSQVGSGRFTNLTHNQVEELMSADANMGFTPDASEIWLAGSVPDKRRLRLMPLMGGTPRVFLRDHAVTVTWSPDGERVAFHTGDPGDPIFVADRTGANATQVFGLSAGGHNHFPTWSPDGRWIYFASGNMDLREMDLWRIPPSGGRPDRLTRHATDVRYIAPLDRRTILYVAPDQDGSGPWLWAVDVERKLSRRVSSGLERYTSIAASSDGRRLVATVANPSAGLWSVPILDRLAEERDAKPFPLPTVRALAPRFRGADLYYLSASGGGDGLWRYHNNQAQEIWKGGEAPLLMPPTVSPDGHRIAVVLKRHGKLRLHLLSSDGAELQLLTEAIDVRGGTCWSPDGKWIVTGGNDGNGDGLFKLSVQGDRPVRLVSGKTFNPVWSPDGTMIVYIGATIGNKQSLQALSPDGVRVELPPIAVYFESAGERYRFLPDGKALVYMQGSEPWQDFWLLDLTTRKTRQLTRLNSRAAMKTFDITPDSKQIVFDRLQENSDIVLIELPK